MSSPSVVPSRHPPPGRGTHTERSPHASAFGPGFLSAPCTPPSQPGGRRPGEHSSAKAAGIPPIQVSAWRRKREQQPPWPRNFSSRDGNSVAGRESPSGRCTGATTPEGGKYGNGRWHHSAQDGNGAAIGNTFGTLLQTTTRNLLVGLLYFLSPTLRVFLNKITQSESTEEVSGTTQANRCHIFANRGCGQRQGRWAPSRALCSAGGGTPERGREPG